ncbi:WhiB family transcriptional regulator [Brachybacterium tyrofermentans]|uniref:WhiB family transcriptional regulator n=1 Tax=Brachybacterium tyrofermentans TaxID=47848 RepID=UPI003FD4DB4C
MSGNTFAVPAHALGAWEEMHEQILATGPTPCAGPDRDDWTGTARQQALAANSCLDCPVLEACAQYAVTASEADGVWGGMTVAERTSWGAA